MGDYEAGLALHQLQHRRLDLALRGSVHVGCGFIKNQHPGVVEHCTGDGQKLLLSLGDVAAILADDRIIAVRKTHYERVDVGLLRNADNIFQRGVLRSVGNVLVHCAPEEPCILKHHCVGRPQARAGIFLLISPVHEDASAVAVVEAHQQVDHGCLSGTRGTDYGNQLSCIGVEAQIMQDGLSFLIAEGHVLETHITLHVGKFHSIFEILGFLGFIEQVEDPFGGGEGREDFVHDVGYLVDGSGELAGIEDERRNLTQRHAAAHE